MEDIYHGKFAYMEGTSDRVCKLLNWNDVNLLLSQHQARYQQIRLVKGGSDIEKERFIRWRISGDGPFQWINIEAVLRELQDGATLVFDCADECSLPIRNVATMLEQKLREPIHANLYASFHTSRGLDTHWTPTGTGMLCSL
jgi:hypothetical protein